MNHHNAKTIELVIFKPKAGFNRDEVKKALESLTPILKSYEGFIDRQLATNDED